MKMYSLTALLAVLVIAGCSTKITPDQVVDVVPTTTWASADVVPTAEVVPEVVPTNDATITGMDNIVESCQKYVSLMKCVAEKSPVETKTTIQSGIDMTLNQINSLTSEQQQIACDAMTQGLGDANKAVYAQLGCSI
jgi:hypothetical protein